MAGDFGCCGKRERERGVLVLGVYVGLGQRERGRLGLKVG